MRCVKSPFPFVVLCFFGAGRFIDDEGAIQISIVPDACIMQHLVEMSSSTGTYWKSNFRHFRIDKEIIQVVTVKASTTYRIASPITTTRLNLYISV